MPVTTVSEPAARDVARFGNHGEHWLTVEHYLAFGEDRIVMQTGGGDVVDARHIFMGQNAQHARNGANGAQVHRHNRRMGACRQAEARMREADGLGHVVNIKRRASDMLVSGIVFGGCMRRAFDRLRGRRHRLMHRRDS